MPLAKKAQTTNDTPTITPMRAAVLEAAKILAPTPQESNAKPPKHLSKEEYWDRKELRDIQRDRDMAWSGIAQAALQSVYVGQFNVENSVDGLVKVVAEVTTKLLALRPK